MVGVCITYGTSVTQFLRTIEMKMTDLNIISWQAALSLFVLPFPYLTSYFPLQNLDDTPEGKGQCSS